MIRSSRRDGAEAFREMGGKAFHLAEMREGGFCVPEFICVTSDEADHMDRVFRALDETCFLSGRPADGEESAECRARNGRKLYAVRSSADVEDGASHSFAGQFQSFLNVSREELTDRIRECAASGSAKTVESYRRQLGSPFSQEAVANAVKASSTAMGLSPNAAELPSNVAEAPVVYVIIQEMVEAEYSGVLFTVNPMGILSETVIVLGEGDGSGVVADRTAVTTCCYNRTDGVDYTVCQEGAPRMQRKLRDRLVRVGEELAARFGRALDIEFAVTTDELHLLQMRPVTTLSGRRPILLDNSNIVESYPGITYPLTMSFIRSVYTDIFSNLIRRLSGGDSLVSQYPQVFSQMVDSCNGRVFYRIDNWYAVIGFLPFSGRIIPVWQEMMGVEARDTPRELPPASLRSKFCVAWNTLRLFFTAPREMARLEREFQSMETRFQSRYREGMTLGGLMELYEDMRNSVLIKWDVTLANDMYAFLYTAMLKFAMRRKGFSDSEANQRISGIGNLASMRPIRELVRLAILYKKEGASPVFLAGFEVYRDRFGDRSIGELKLETDTFRERPELLMRQVEAFAGMEEPEELYERLCRQDDGGEGCWSGENRGSSGLRRPRADGPLIRFLSRRAALGIGWRESSRINRARLFGFARRLFLDMGSRLAEEGLLNHAQDVFWLEVGEIFDWCKAPEDVGSGCGDSVYPCESDGSVGSEGAVGSEDFVGSVGADNSAGAGSSGGAESPGSSMQRRCVDLRDLAAARRAEYSFYETLPAYKRIVFDGVVKNRPPTADNAPQQAGEDAEADTLHGTPCSSGKAVGAVLVIRDISKNYDTSGKILVTVSTDPGWVFLLARAKGIISEKGSLLSHTAIISRELRIPSVVGVNRATELLHDGDMVEMDCDSGEIRILQRVPR